MGSLSPHSLYKEGTEVFGKAANAKKPRISAMRRSEIISGYAFFFPTILGIVLLTYGQMAYSLFISFTNWDIFGNCDFVGIQNYVELLTKDIFFWKSMRQTLLYAFGSVVAAQFTALLMALLLNVKGIGGKAIFRTLLYIPSVVPAVASNLLWLWMFNPDYGLLNAALSAVGLPKLQWIFAESTAVPSMWIMSAWACGGPMVIYLAGLANVPTELLEACEIDGGNTWTKFRHITIPMISPTLFYNCLMGVIGGFMVFNQAYIMTNGGPNNATLFVNFLIYREAFSNNQFGYASSLAWVVFIVLGLCTLLIFKLFGKKVYYGSAND